jgi:hypothetical protein
MPINVKDVKRYHQRPDRLGGPTNEIPEPIEIDGQDCYQVEEILAERYRKGQHQVLVKWEGIDLLDATWEPLGNMPPAVVNDWRRLQGKADAFDEAGEPLSDAKASDQEEDGNQFQEDESAVKDRGKLKWLRIGGYPWWPSIVATMADVPVHLRTKLWQDKSRKPGARLLFTFGDRKWSWGTLDRMHEWQGQRHREYEAQGKGKLFKAALQECKQEAEVPGSQFPRHT